MSATDPRPTAEQLAPIKDAAVDAYRSKVGVDDVSAFWSEHPNMSFNGARKHLGIHRAVEEAVPSLTALALEHAAEFLRSRDFANLDPAAVLFAQWVAEEFDARAVALVNGAYDTEEQQA